MKATGIVRRIDDLGRVVIPKEIRRTLRIREGDPPQIPLIAAVRFCIKLIDFSEKIPKEPVHNNKPNQDLTENP